MSAPHVQQVGTGQGPARLHWYPADEQSHWLVLGHGAGGGVEAPDLRLAASTLPRQGVGVVLLEQPWRVAGRRVAPRPAQLDQAWREAISAADRLAEYPVMLGGRSAGARVACRTAVDLGAVAVLALAFPLHPPGRPERSRAGELCTAGVPVMILQGDRDPFGRAEEFDALCPDDLTCRLITVPGAGHDLVTARRTSQQLGRDPSDILTDSLLQGLVQLRALVSNNRE